jgi:hypothetical protein
MELGVVTGEKTIAPVHFALEQFSVGLDHLVKIVEDGGLDDLDDAELIGFLQGFERVRNRLPMADHRLLADAERRGLPDAVTQPSLVGMLMATLRLSRERRRGGFGPPTRWGSGSRCWGSRCRRSGRR